MLLNIVTWRSVYGTVASAENITSPLKTTQLPQSNTHVTLLSVLRLAAPLLLCCCFVSSFSPAFFLPLRASPWANISVPFQTNRSVILSTNQRLRSSSDRLTHSYRREVDFFSAPHDPSVESSVAETKVHFILCSLSSNHRTHVGNHISLTQSCYIGSCSTIERTYTRNTAEMLLNLEGSDLTDPSGLLSPK